MPPFKANVLLAVSLVSTQALCVGAFGFRSDACIAIICFAFSYITTVDVLPTQSSIRSVVWKALRTAAVFVLICMAAIVLVLSIFYFSPSKKNSADPKPGTEPTSIFETLFYRISNIFYWLQAFLAGETFEDLITLSLRLDYSNSISAKSPIKVELDAGRDTDNMHPSALETVSYAPAHDDDSPAIIASSATLLSHTDSLPSAYLPRLPPFSKPYHTTTLFAFVVSAILVQIGVPKFASLFPPNLRKPNEPRFMSYEESRQIYVGLLIVPTLLALVGSLLALAFVRGELSRVWAYSEDAWGASVTTSSTGAPADEKARRETARPPRS